jgi:hypothetical protein
MKWITRERVKRGAEIGWLGAGSTAMVDGTRSQDIKDAVRPHTAALARAPHAIHLRICTAADD